MTFLIDSMKNTRMKYSSLRSVSEFSMTAKLTLWRRACLAASVFVALIASTACNFSDLTPAAGNTTPEQPYQTQLVPLSSLELKQSADCSDLKAYIKKSLIKTYTTIPHYQYCSMPRPVLGEGSGGAAGGDVLGTAPATGDIATGSPKAAAPDGVSDTNNQEAGVNEGDIVKNDEAGNVYILSGRHLIIAKGFPPQELTTLKEVDLGARGLDLFLDRANNRLVVIAREETPYYITDPVPLAADAIAIRAPERSVEYSIAIFLDVADPANPVVLEQFQFKGYFREGRRIDGRLHLISNYYLQLDNLYNDPDFRALQSQFWTAINDAACADKGLVGEDLASDPGVQLAQANLGDKISAVVDTMNPQDYLPDALRNNAGVLEPIPYLSCQDIHHPDVDMNLGLQVVSSVDTDGANLSAAGIINNAWITYASADNLYLADTSAGWWWASDTNQPPTSQTAIYKFSISSGKPQYVATGRVDGYAKDQFSFSEYDGVLRVATTQNDSIVSYDDTGQQIWSRHLNNHLFVLQDNAAGKLNVIGGVRDFVADETIRSARFFGNKGFVVTFRNIDPLFAFDLSQANNPKLMGELTLPGFSTYIHAYDDNHIMTIGRAGGVGGTGVGNGLQLQLLDIRNIANPVLLHSYTPNTVAGWSWSDAEYDHKAFTFYKPANLLAIPMMVTPSYSSEVFNGIVAFNVTLESGFSELGKVDHADLSKDYYCGSTSLRPEYITDCSNGWYVSWAAPRRSVVMTDTDNVYLYSISDIGMKVSATSDLSSTIASILFPSQPYPWWYFGPIGIPLGTGTGISGGGVASGGIAASSDQAVGTVLF